MLKKILCAGLLASGVAVPAAAESWTFSYVGFYNQEAGFFDSTRVLSGSFSGEDWNHDGVLSKTELTDLYVNGTDFIGCAASSGGDYYCGASNFTYSAGGALNFTVSEGGSDPEGWVSGGNRIVAGDVHFSYTYRPGNEWTQTLRWTNQTAFTITNVSLPVPEPSTYAMWLLGLVGVAGLQRCRRRA